MERACVEQYELEFLAGNFKKVKETWPKVHVHLIYESLISAYLNILTGCVLDVYSFAGPTRVLEHTHTNKEIIEVYEERPPSLVIRCLGKARLKLGGIARWFLR